MPHRAISVLYIDDDLGLARLVQKNLQRKGYIVEHAGDAEAGLARIRQGGIDVVGLDHYLPRGTGLDVLGELKAMESPPAVVYVTGSAETDVAVSAMKAGAFDYVTKSVADDFLELLAGAIDQAADRARLLRAKDKVESDLREAKDRAELLLREVNHRVANSLAVVAALVRMQAAAVTEPAAKAALTETQARITAIAGVHKRLYTSDDVRFVDIDAYLKALISDLDTSLTEANEANRLVLCLEPVRMPTDMAISIGIIAAELVTNAFKYAYPQGKSGQVRIVLRTQPDGALLAVEDDGIGWSGTGEAKGTGLGTKLMQTMAANLGAEMRYEPRSIGTRAVFEIPL